MGKYNGSPWGTIKNKLGEAVGSSSRGQKIVRAMPSGYTDKNTLAQRENRARQIIKTRNMSDLLVLLKPFIHVKKLGNTAYSMLLAGYKNAAIGFTSPDEGDTVDDLLAKVAVTGVDIEFGDGTIRKPIVSDVGTFDSSTKVYTVPVTNISAYTKTPTDAVYRLFVIQKDGLEAWFSDTEVAIDCHECAFTMPANFDETLFWGFVILANADESSVCVAAGQPVVS